MNMVRNVVLAVCVATLGFGLGPVVFARGEIQPFAPGLIDAEFAAVEAARTDKTKSQYRLVPFTGLDQSSLLFINMPDGYAVV